MVFLIIPATSIPSERIFSLCGLVITPNRSRLTKEHVNHLVFLYVNCRSREELDKEYKELRELINSGQMSSFF